MSEKPPTLDYTAPLKRAPAGQNPWDPFIPWAVIVVVIFGGSWLAQWAYERVAQALRDSYGFDRAHQELLDLSRALNRFRTDNGRLPTVGEGLGALVSAPPRVSNWHGPYLTATLPAAAPPTDPWGRPYVYHPIPGGGYVVLSVGPDGKEGTADDIRPAGK